MLEWRERDGVRWLSARLPGAEVAFSTRIGGVSDAPFDTLNLGLLTQDEGQAVLENRKRLSRALGFEPERVAIALQVHGGDIVAHHGPQEPSPFARYGVAMGEGDAHWTRVTELALLVFVADCLPIALANAGAVAMLHGGWRPLAAGIVEKGAAAVGAASTPTRAAIGPGIGPCCFEVGDEVLERFAGLGDDVADGRMLDLPEVTERLLERAGIEVVERSELCTRCNPDLFFSHRGQGGLTGRQAGLVWRTA
jgi:YfiH family protein